MEKYQLSRELVRRKDLIEQGMKGNPSLAYVRTWVVKERVASGKWKAVRYFGSEDEARSWMGEQASGDVPASAGDVPSRS